MTVIELEDDIAEVARAQASAHGLDIGAYFASLIEQAAQLKQDNIQEKLKALDEFFSLAQDRPALRDETFSREMIYADHD